MYHPLQETAWARLVEIDSIVINRDERQRKDIVTDDLEDSLARRGQLQPIVITRDLVLVAGERRTTAAKKLGWTHLKAVFTDEIDPGELQALELEENIKRLDLPWRDNCLAVLTYHEYRSANSSEWTNQATAEALGLSKATVSDQLAVAREIRKGNSMVKDAPKMSTAVGIVRRSNERKEAAETSQLLSMVSKPAVSTSSPEEALTASILEDLEASGTGYILNENFTQWAMEYSGPKFNLIHCDFPYGVGMHDSDQGSGDAYGTYEDTPEIYWSLIDTLLNNLDNFAEPQAHLLFWFSMDYYQDTFERLSSKFVVNRFPLVWVKTDNSGILPDANRGPRRTYETAFLASRGDRKIVRSVSNHVGSPIQRGRHMSEKPQAVLGHFFRMLVDEHSSVLDPTCGSGSAIRAAITAGADRYLGLELNTEFADYADETLKRFLEERK